METNLVPTSLLRRLWQKLFLRVEDAYRFPPQEPTCRTCPVLYGHGLVEAIDIPSPGSVGLPQGPLRSDSVCHVTDTGSTGVAETPSSIDSGFSAAPAMTPPLQPVAEGKRGSQCNDFCPAVVPFYSVNTDPLDVHIVITDDCPSCGGSVEDVCVAGLDGIGETTWDQGERMAGILWKRSLFISAQETPPEPKQPLCTMGMPIRLDPAVVCDLDTGPFDRPCCESVFFDAISEG